MDIDTKIRKLAKSQFWQSIFNASLKNSGIHLFQNVDNFSGLQIYFIYWLNCYNLLYEELAKHEDDKLTEDVLSDDFRTDSYLTYRNKKNDYLWKKYRREEKLRELQDRNTDKKKKFSEGKKTLINVDLRREK
jgi:hypothetical protein